MYMYIFNNIKISNITGGCLTACENPFPQAAHLVNRLCKWISTGGSKAIVCAVVLFPPASSAGGAEKRQ
jgi:hypothetical protein